MGEFYWNSNNSFDEDNRENKIGVVGLVLAIIASFVCSIPILGVIMAIIALVFCRKAKKFGNNDISVRIGYITSIIGIIVSGVNTIIFLVPILFSTVSVNGSIDRAKENTLKNYAIEIEGWFENQYELASNGFSSSISDEFIDFCGYDGGSCIGSTIKFRVSGGREVLEKIGIDTDNIDLVNSSININNSGNICVILYGNEDGIYSEFSKDNLGEKGISSTGCSK